MAFLAASVAVVLVVFLVARVFGGGEDPQPLSQQQTCEQVAGGFVTVYMDKTTPDQRWRELLATWTTREAVERLAGVDRVDVRPVTPTGVSTQTGPSECAVTVTFRDAGPLLVRVVDAGPDGWRVSSWGAP